MLFWIPFSGIRFPHLDSRVTWLSCPLKFWPVAVKTKRGFNCPASVIFNFYLKMKIFCSSFIYIQYLVIPPKLECLIVCIFLIVPKISPLNNFCTIFTNFRVSINFSKYYIFWISSSTWFQLALNFCCIKIFKSPS